MNCEEYVTDYLSAHADGELTPGEKDAVVRHLGSGPQDGCATCRARLAEERLLKTLIRRQAATVKAPEEVQARIRAALEALDHIDRGPVPRRIGIAVVREVRRPRTWAPLAAAAMLFVVVWAGGLLPGIHRGAVPTDNGVSSIPATEALDQAVYSYETFETAFRPTVPSGSLADIAMAYGEGEMPDTMWNFEYAGYGVVGGRIHRLNLVTAWRTQSLCGWKRRRSTGSAAWPSQESICTISQCRSRLGRRSFWVQGIIVSCRRSYS